MAMDQRVLSWLSQHHWISLKELAQTLSCPISQLWDPLQDRPVRGIVRRAERLYAIKVHRHQITFEGIWVADAHQFDTTCPRCHAGGRVNPGLTGPPGH